MTQLTRDLLVIILVAVAWLAGLLWAVFQVGHGLGWHF